MDIFPQSILRLAESVKPTERPTVYRAAALRMHLKQKQNADATVAIIALFNEL